jgi:hypothetical protein
VILEYDQDEWKIVYGTKPWQVLTNKPVYNVPDSSLKENCWRYRTISEALGAAGGILDWDAGMKILQDVQQIGTTWSVIYRLQAGELYFSVYQNWDTVYHLSFPVQ